MINRNKITVLFLFLCVTFEQCYSKIPDYIQVCKRDQDTINECVRKSVEVLRPKLLEGIPEIDVPSLDPFYISEISPSSSSNTKGFQATGKDIMVSGAGNYSIKSVELDLEKQTFRARIRFPKLHFEGKYKVDIQFLLLPIRGEGTLSADAIKCTVDCLLRYKIVERNGVEYIEFTDLDNDINIRDYKINLQGLFNGDKSLEEATNQALNENKAELIKAVKPFAEKSVSNIILDAANKITKNIPYDELLPKP
ncbi:protein takeout-like [Battus philenor]|uniref:protein takeout-like n=1 Tax=Battus philenor TaxID=42288 RepID=UPI0035CEC881